MSALNISNYRITIAAGQEEAIWTRGTRLRCLYASGPFRVGLESEATFPFEGGMAVSLPDGAEFSHLRLVNPGAAAITVEIVVSFGEFRDDRSTFAGTLNTAITSMPAVTIAAGQSVGISGTPSIAVTSLPAVTIAGTPNVNATITGTPNVNATIAPGQAVTLTGAPMVSRENLWATFAADMSVGTTPFKLVDAYAAYRELVVQNISFNPVRVAGTSSVSSSFGLVLQPWQTLSIAHRGELWACTQAGIAKLSVVYIRI